MIVIIIGILIIGWAIIQKNIIETTGEAPMTRGAVEKNRPGAWLPDRRPGVRIDAV